MFPAKGIKNLKWLTVVVFIFTAIAFVYAVWKDPGYVKKSDKVSFLKLNQYFDPSYICPKCEILKP